VDDETGPVFAERSPVVKDAPNIPTPPFWGMKVRKDFDLRELFPFINETALFKNQWQLKTASQEDYLRLVEQEVPSYQEAIRRGNHRQRSVGTEGGLWIFPGPE
jgi:cobalamin-dependent methionine synthase I